MKNFSSLRGLLLCMLITAFGHPGALAQSVVASGYSFSTGTGTYTDIYPGGTAATTIQVDDAYTTVPIGFNFKFCGTIYSDVTICSNGWLRFGSGAGTSVANWNYNHQVNSGVYPCVYVLYEDISMVGATSNYITTGTAGNRIFKWEGRNVLWDYLGTAPCISFQVWLYEATGVIECRYRQESGLVNIGTSGGCTIGIANSATDYQTLSDATSNPTSSSSTYTYTITSRPATGQIYRWDPGPSCPVPSGLTITRVNSTEVDFSWGAAGSSVGYEYIVDQNSSPLPTSTPKSTSGTNVSETGLMPNTGYYIHLRNKCGATNFSSWITIPFTTLPPCIVPNPPGIIVTKLDTVSASLAWAKTSTTIDYEYILKDEPGTPTGNPGTTVTANNVADFQPLIPGKTYYFFLRVRCQGNDTSGWLMDSIYVPMPCHAPNVNFTGVNGTRVVAYWNAPATAYEYELIVSRSQLASPTNGIFTTATSRLFPFLDEGAEYYVYARSYCDDRSVRTISNWSEARVSTWALGVDGPPGDGSVLGIYPNPASSALRISIRGDAAPGQITILDATGRILKTVAVNTGNIVLDVSDLPGGLYMVNYAGTGISVQAKFTKI